MKKLSYLILAMLFSTAAMAQGSLQFNDIKIISNSSTAVPAGKVWKVMSVYGKQADQCLLQPAGTTPASWIGNKYWSYKTRGFQVNGETVWQSISETTFGIWYDAACTSAYTTRSWSDPDALSFRNAVGHLTADDLSAMLPFWLPAGATVNSLSSAQYLSVMEFNVIP